MALTQTHGKNLFCPMCHTRMVKEQVRKNQHARNLRGELVTVTRVFYGCPNSECRTICHFDYREDGKQGDLYSLMQVAKFDRDRLNTD